MDGEKRPGDAGAGPAGAVAGEAGSGGTAGGVNVRLQLVADTKNNRKRGWSGKP